VAAARVRAGLTATPKRGEPLTENAKRFNAKQGKLYRKIVAKRDDAQWKLAQAQASQYQVNVLEDLQIKNMTKKGAGKRGLNKSILAESWYSFDLKLTQKAREYGGSVIKVPPAYTSMLCHACGDKTPGNRVGERYKCSACGHTDDADVNAAKNILAIGLTREPQVSVSAQEGSRIAIPKWVQGVVATQLLNESRAEKKKSESAEKRKKALAEQAVSAVG
jgi:IS605 OrfB family transposase